MILSNTSGWAVKKYGWEKAIQMYAEAGYDALDANFCDMLNEDFQGGIWAADRYIEQAHTVRAYFDKYGLRCNQLHAPFSFPAKVWDEHLEDICIPYVVRSLEIGAILGADVCVIHPLHHFVYQGNEEEAFRRNMDYYGRFKDIAHKLGIRIGVENMWQRDPRRGYICHDTCSRSEEYIRYLDTLNDPAFVACLDLGHIDIVQREDEAKDVIRALGHGRLHALHVHDNDYKNDSHQMPFFGKMDWQSICRALGEIDYDGDLTYEVGGAYFRNMPDEFVPTAMKFSADIGRQLIKMIDEARPNKD